MDELFKRIDKSKIAPWFLEKCEKLIEECLKQGRTFYAISAFRDPVEQEKLYAIGRTTETHRKPVTNAAPYKSFHNFGLAIDFCLDKDAEKAGLQPDWDYEDYKILANEALKIGLTPGYYFKSFPEGPHIQTPFLGGTTKDMEAIMKEKGVEAVWEHVLKNLQTHNNTKQFWG